MRKKGFFSWWIISSIEEKNENWKRFNLRLKNARRWNLIGWYWSFFSISCFSPFHTECFLFVVDTWEEEKKRILFFFFRIEIIITRKKETRRRKGGKFFLRRCCHFLSSDHQGFHRFQNTKQCLLFLSRSSYAIAFTDIGNDGKWRII